MEFIEASRKLPEQELSQTVGQNILKKEEDDIILPWAQISQFSRIYFDSFNMPRF